jgi:virginiamycin B lyase
LRDNTYSMALSFKRAVAGGVGAGLKKDAELSALLELSITQTAKLEVNLDVPAHRSMLLRFGGHTAIREAIKSVGLIGDATLGIIEEVLKALKLSGPGFVNWASLSSMDIFKGSSCKLCGKPEVAASLKLGGMAKAELEGSQEVCFSAEYDGQKVSIDVEAEAEAKGGVKATDEAKERTLGVIKGKLGAVLNWIFRKALGVISAKLGTIDPLTILDKGLSASLKGGGGASFEFDHIGVPPGSDECNLRAIYWALKAKGTKPDARKFSWTFGGGFHKWSIDVTLTAEGDAGFLDVAALGLMGAGAAAARFAAFYAYGKDSTPLSFTVSLTTENLNVEGSPKDLLKKKEIELPIEIEGKLKVSSTTTIAKGTTTLGALKRGTLEGTWQPVAAVLESKPALSTTEPAPVPAPAVPTPAVPTPALPTPALPTPALPTPALPTPALPTPVAPTPAAGGIDPGKLLDLGVGADSEVWVVNLANVVFRLVDGKWRQMPGRLTRISVGSKSHVWGVNHNGDVFQWTGGAWRQIPGKLVQVSAGADGSVFGVNRSDQIYRLVGGAFRELPGRLVGVTVASATDVWGVDRQDSTFRWTGHAWSRVQGQLTSVATAADGTVLGTNRGTVYRHLGSGKWAKQPQTLTRVAVGSASNILGITPEGALVRLPAASAPPADAPVLAGMEADSNRPGYDFRNFALPEPRPELCRQACEQEPACRAFTYVKPGTSEAGGKGPHCWLKHQTSSRVANACCISGVVTKPAGVPAVMPQRPSNGPKVIVPRRARDLK